MAKFPPKHQVIRNAVLLSNIGNSLLLVEMHNQGHIITIIKRNNHNFIITIHETDTMVLSFECLLKKRFDIFKLGKLFGVAISKNCTQLIVFRVKKAMISLQGMAAKGL